MEEGTHHTEIHRRVGSLEGRVSSVERDQDFLKGQLATINSKLSWLLGGVAATVALIGAAAWWMVKTGVPPLG